MNTPATTLQIDTRTFRMALGRFAMGVTVITAGPAPSPPVFKRRPDLTMQTGLI
jgi:hypothetical protein